jgi:exonuclease V gamma subunit
MYSVFTAHDINVILHKFIADLNKYRNQVGLFTTISVVVPHRAMALWLKYRIADTNGICANIDFVIISDFISRQINNYVAIDADRSISIIYSKLCVLADRNMLPFNIPGDYCTIFNIAVRLSKIFRDYLYLYTRAIISGNFIATLPHYQQLIWHTLFEEIALAGLRTYLDLYQSNFDKTRDTVFMFCINYLHSSQLEILLKLPLRLFWYLCVPSNEYYGDLLPRVNAGNLLLANFGIRSKLMHDMFCSYDVMFDCIECACYTNNLLQIIQNDVKRVIYRDKTTAVSKEYLSDGSINIYVAYSRLAEITHLFDQITILMNNGVSISDIIVIAPDIFLYHKFIDAVFCDIDHNFVRSIGESSHWLFLKKLLQLPSILNIQYFNSLLEHAVGVLFAANEIAYIKLWMSSNVLDTYNVLKKLVLGFCLPHQLAYDYGKLPVFDSCVAYDNIEFNQMVLVNKLSILFDIIDYLHGKFIDEQNLRSVAMTDLIDGMEVISDKIIQCNNEYQDVYADFISFLVHYQGDASNIWNISALSILLDKFLRQRSFVELNGQLTFASIHDMVAIPYSVVYMLGMNCGEFPNNYADIFDNKASYIATDASQQNFLDILLTAKDKLFISYVGIDARGNILEPSSVVVMLKQVIADTVNCKNEIVQRIEHQSYAPCVRDLHFNISLPSVITFEALVNTYLHSNYNLKYMVDFMDGEINYHDKLTILDTHISRKFYVAMQNLVFKLGVDTVQDMYVSGQLLEYFKYINIFAELALFNVRYENYMNMYFAYQAM